MKAKWTAAAVGWIIQKIRHLQERAVLIQITTTDGTKQHKITFKTNVNKYNKSINTIYVIL